MKPYSMEVDAVIETLSSSQSSGLTKEQVEERRERYGENKLKEKKKVQSLQRSGGVAYSASKGGAKRVKGAKQNHPKLKPRANDD